MIVLVVLFGSESTTVSHVETGLRVEWFPALIREVWYSSKDIIEITTASVLIARIGVLVVVIVLLA